MKSSCGTLRTTVAVEAMVPPCCPRLLPRNFMCVIVLSGHDRKDPLKICKSRPVTFSSLRPSPAGDERTVGRHWRLAPGSHRSLLPYLPVRASAGVLIPAKQMVTEVTMPFIGTGWGTQLWASRTPVGHQHWAKCNPSNFCKCGKILSFFSLSDPF